MTRAEAIDTSSGSTAEREVSLEVDGGRIVGWMSGVGPPMLLLHGGPGLSDYLGQLAGELSSAFTVFRYQQRGLAPSVVEGDRSVEGHMAEICCESSMASAGRSH